MEQRMKIIIGASVGGVALIGGIVGIVFLVKAYKDGKFVKIINRLKTLFNGPAVAEIEISRDGTLELQRVRILDANGADLSGKSTYTYAWSTIWNGHLPQFHPKWVIPTYTAGNNYISADLAGQFVKFTLNTPIFKAKSLFIEVNPSSWAIRMIGLKVVVRDMLGKDIINTVITTPGNNITIPLTL